MMKEIARCKKLTSVGIVTYILEKSMTRRYARVRTEMVFEGRKIRHDEEFLGLPGAWKWYKDLRPGA